LARHVPCVSLLLSVTVTTTVTDRASASNCKHLDKAFNAYKAGAAAVIIVDSDDTPNIAVADGVDIDQQRDLQVCSGSRNDA
jgi:hypothetical protein